MPDTNTFALKLPFSAKKLLIHRPPMLLIDTLVEREGNSAAASATISSGNICLSPQRGILPEYFIEIIAQTMAAANGYDALMEQKPPTEGFIVGLDKFKLYGNPANEGEFIVRIRQNMVLGSMKVMEGEALSGTTTVASVELKVWEPSKEEASL